MLNVRLVLGGWFVGIVCALKLYIYTYTHTHDILNIQSTGYCGVSSDHLISVHYFIQSIPQQALPR